MLRSYAALRAREDVFPPGSWFSPFSGRKAGEAEQGMGGPGEHQLHNGMRQEGELPHPEALCASWMNPGPFYRFFSTLEDQFPGAQRGWPFVCFLYAIYVIPEYHNGGWTLDLLPPGCHFTCTIFFSISTRKCYLTLSVFLSHWNSNLQQCLESQTQRSGPLTTQWCVKKNQSKETTKASRSQMKDPNDFAEMSMWVIYLVLPEEDTIKEYDNFQGFYWHTLHSLKEEKNLFYDCWE